MSDAVLYDMHMHTPLCGHAEGWPEEYARVAEKRGLSGIAFTCHAPAPEDWGQDVRMAVDELHEYVDLINVARHAWRDRVDILLGLESDYAPGMESWLEELHSHIPLDYVLGSVHPFVDEYRNRYFNGDIQQFQRIYFEHLALAAESGLFDCLAHPDIVKNCFAEEWDPMDIIDDIKLALDRIAETRTAMEFNTSGLLKAVPEMNPGRLILEEIQQRSIPIVLGSDAHCPERVGADFECALGILEDAGFSRISYFLGRQRRESDLAGARTLLRAIEEVSI